MAVRLEGGALIDSTFSSIQSHSLSIGYSIIKSYTPAVDLGCANYRGRMFFKFNTKFNMH